MRVNCGIPVVLPWLFPRSGHRRRPSLDVLQFTRYSFLLDCSLRVGASWSSQKNKQDTLTTATLAHDSALDSGADPLQICIEGIEGKNGFRIFSIKQNTIQDLASFRGGLTCQQLSLGIGITYFDLNQSSVPRVWLSGGLAEDLPPPASQLLLLLPAPQSVLFYQFQNGLHPYDVTCSLT